jgi:hypothetical protein
MINRVCAIARLPNVVFDHHADGRIVGIKMLETRAQLSAELLSNAAQIFDRVH